MDNDVGDSPDKGAPPNENDEVGAAPEKLTAAVFSEDIAPVPNIPAWSALGCPNNDPANVEAALLDEDDEVGTPNKLNPGCFSEDVDLKSPAEAALVCPNNDSPDVWATLPNEDEVTGAPNKLISVGFSLSVATRAAKPPDTEFIASEEKGAGTAALPKIPPLLLWAIF